MTFRGSFIVKWVANDDWLQKSCVDCKRVQIAHERVYAVSSHYSAVKTLCIMAIHWVMFRHSAVGSDTSSEVMSEVTPWLKCCSVICLLSIWLTAVCFSISNHTLDLHWILMIIDLLQLRMVQSRLTRGFSFRFGHSGFEFNQILFVVFLSCSFCLLICSSPSSSSSFLRVCHTELEVCGGSVFEREEKLWPSSYK